MTVIEKPIRPGDYDCCESGCSPCIWDVYFEELEYWKEMQAEKSKVDENPEVVKLEKKQG